MGVGTEEEEAKARAKPGLGRWAAAPARGGRAGTEGGRASVSPFCVRTPSARVRCFPIESSPPSRAAWTAETHGHLRAPGTVLGRAGKSRTEEPRGLVSGAAGGAGGVSPARLCCADPQPRRRRPSAGARRRPGGGRRFPNQQCAVPQSRCKWPAAQSPSCSWRRPCHRKCWTLSTAHVPGAGRRSRPRLTAWEGLPPA